jgi:hypothetical protein
VLFHEWSAVFAFGFDEIMRSAPKLDIRCVMFAAAGIRLDVVKLETFGFGTPAAGCIYKRTLSFIALVDSALDGSRDIARRSGGIGLVEALPGSLGRSIALGLELLELFGHRFFNDCREITIGHG